MTVGHLLNESYLDCFSFLSTVLETRMEAGATPLEKLKFPACMCDAVGDAYPLIAPALAPQECPKCEDERRAAQYRDFMEELGRAPA